MRRRPVKARLYVPEQEKEEEEEEDLQAARARLDVPIRSPAV